MDDGGEKPPKKGRTMGDADESGAGGSSNASGAGSACKFCGTAVPAENVDTHVARCARVHRDTGGSGGGGGPVSGGGKAGVGPGGVGGESSSSNAQGT